MAIQHHVPSHEPEGHPSRTCLYCGETWPCEPALIKREVIELVLAKVEPGDDVLCCDYHAARYALRGELAEEIKEI
jgi:hypothetical protein